MHFTTVAFVGAILATSCIAVPLTIPNIPTPGTNVTNPLLGPADNLPAPPPDSMTPAKLGIDPFLKPTDNLPAPPPGTIVSGTILAARNDGEVKLTDEGFMKCLERHKAVKLSIAGMEVEVDDKWMRWARGEIEEKEAIAKTEEMKASKKHMVDMYMPECGHYVAWEC